MCLVIFESPEQLVYGHTQNQFQQLWFGAVSEISKNNVCGEKRTIKEGREK